MEIWKNTPGYEGIYQVSNFGRVKGLKGTRWKNKIKILKLQIHKNGYIQVNFTLDGEVKRYLVHRLVLLAFKGESKLHCNHKNGIKSDNRLENLEYCTRSENMLHSFRKLGRKPTVFWKDKLGKNNPNSKQLSQYDIEGNFIKLWYGCAEASRILGINENGIRNCIKGLSKTSGGYKWAYN